jgi:hypothetical protein
LAKLFYFCELRYLRRFLKRKTCPLMFPYQTYLVSLIFFLTIEFMIITKIIKRTKGYIHPPTPGLIVPWPVYFVLCLLNDDEWAACLCSRYEILHTSPMGKSCPLSRSFFRLAALAAQAEVPAHQVGPEGNLSAGTGVWWWWIFQDLNLKGVGAARVFE